jgi:hypothetical protein
MRKKLFAVMTVIALIVFVSIVAIAARQPEYDSIPYVSAYPAEHEAVAANYQPEYTPDTTPHCSGYYCELLGFPKYVAVGLPMFGCAMEWLNFLFHYCFESNPPLEIINNNDVVDPGWEAWYYEWVESHRSEIDPAVYEEWLAAALSETSAAASSSSCCLLPPRLNQMVLDAIRVGSTNQCFRTYHAYALICNSRNGCGRLLSGGAGIGTFTTYAPHSFNTQGFCSRCGYGR